MVCIEAESFCVAEENSAFSVISADYHDYSGTLAADNVEAVYAGAYQGACKLDDGSVISSHVSSAVSVKPESVALSTALAVALNYDGTLSSSFDRLPEWDNMIAISLNSRALIGITAEGKAESFFFRETDEIDFCAEGMSVVSVSCGGGHYLLLDDEGNVHAYGDNEFGQCDTAGWNLA